MSARRSEQYEPIIKLNPFTLTLMIVGLIMIIVLVFGIKAWVEGWHSDKQIKIDNLTSKVKDLPRSSSNAVQKALYDTVRANIPYDQDAPTDGAKIRENVQIENTFSDKTNVHYARFIVDIEKVHQSYDVQMEWVNDSAYRKNMSGYPVVISCVDESAVIYEDFDCTDMQSTSGDYGGNALVTARNSASIINFTKIKDASVSDLTYQSIYKTTAQYFTTVYGSSSSLSLNKDSFKKEDNKIEFDLISINKNTYHFVIVLDGNNYKLTTSSDSDELYTYDSSMFKTPKKNINAIRSRYLPYRGKTDNGDDFTFRVRVDGDFEISVNSCGKQSIKDTALAKTTEWLEGLGYDIEEFEVKIPDYCDKDAH